MKMCKNLEILSDKKKRVQSRACELTRRRSYYYYSARTNDYVGSLPLGNKDLCGETNESLCACACCAILLEDHQYIPTLDD